MSKLTRLAKAVYMLTKEETWVGGKQTAGSYAAPTGPWPPELKSSDGWSWAWDKGTVWTLSPEVTIGQHRLRVCVFWNGDQLMNHGVKVFVDDVQKHPGGHYAKFNWWFSGWSWRLAKQMYGDNGSTLPVSRSDTLLEAAKCMLADKKTSPASGGLSLVTGNECIINPHQDAERKERYNE